MRVIRRIHNTVKRVGVGAILGNNNGNLAGGVFGCDRFGKTMPVIAEIGLSTFLISFRSPLIWMN